MLGWGDSVVARCDAVVFLTLDPAERLRRIEARDRVRRESGRVDESALTAFLTWARGYDEPSFQGRSRTGHEDWLATLTCPILRLRRMHAAIVCTPLAINPSNGPVADQAGSVWIDCGS